MNKRYILLFLAYGFPCLVFAQINNRLLENHIFVADTLRQQLMLSVQSNNFFKNNEYFGNIIKGYTLMGSQMGTQLAYQPNENVRIQTGVFLQKDFGNDTGLKVRPILSCKIQQNGYSVLFGNLEGNFSHRMIEPVYNYERFITEPLESGLQIKIDRAKIWSDTWINWEVMQYLGSNYQEQFSVGHHSDITLLQKGASTLSLPIQFLVAHRGGQIDIDTTPLKSTANAVIGFTWQLTSPEKESFIQSFKTENYLVAFKALPPTAQSIYKGGYALYLNATAISRFDIAASVGFWHGNHYASPRGGFLFQSEASPYGKKGYVEPVRRLLFFRLQYAHKVFDAVNVDVRFEPYYDLGNALFEYNYAVYFTYHNDFTLFNFAKRK